MSKRRISELEQDYEVMSTLMNSARENNDRLSISLELLEKNSTRDRLERDEMEKRLADANKATKQLAKFKQESQEFSQLKLQMKAQMATIREGKIASESEMEQLQRELDALRKRHTWMECRLENLSKEKTVWQEDMDELRGQICQAKHELETEVGNRVRAESELEMMKRGTFTRPRTFPVADIVVDDEEKALLKIKIDTLSAAAEEQRIKDERRTRGYEQELEKHRDRISYLTKEMSIVAEGGQAIIAMNPEIRTISVRIIEMAKEILDIGKVAQIGKVISGGEILTLTNIFFFTKR